MTRKRLFTILMAGALVLAACGSDDGGDTTTAPTDTTAPSAGETSAPDAGDTTTTAAEDMASGVHTSDTDLGTILVDPDGFTLYVFTPDVDGESTCYDTCAATWPPVPADTEISTDLDAAMFGSTERTDGTQQLTVNGQPLYLFAPDTAPGDTNGQGVNDVWWVVDADGNLIGG